MEEWQRGEPGRENRVIRMKKKNEESEDERTGSKTVGAAFFVDEVSRNWSKKRCVNTSLCVRATKTKPEKKRRGANMISPPWQPGSRAQPGFPLARGRTRKSRRGGGKKGTWINPGLKAMEEADGVKGSLNKSCSTQWSHQTIQIGRNANRTLALERRGNGRTTTSESKKEILFWASHPANLRQHYSFTRGRVVARKQLELIADHVSHFALTQGVLPIPGCLQTASCSSPSPGQADVEHWEASGGVVDEGACWSNS